jgi:hypothetical protein
MVLTCCTAWPQVGNPFLQDFEKFRQQAKSNYEKFRDEANRRYVDLLRGKWHPYEPEEPLIKPKDNDLPPVILDEEEARKPIESRPIKIEGAPIPLPFAKPQPEPLAPILAITPVKPEPVKPEPVKPDPVKPDPVKPDPVKTEPVKPEPVRPKQEEEPRVSFSYFGTPMSVRFSKSQALHLTACTADAIADGWQRMTEKDYDTTLHDCLLLRKRHQMSDWAYLLLLDSVAHACTAGNEATLMQSYLYQQSGYKLRMGIADGRLALLFATDHTLYDHPYFRMDGSNYYVYAMKKADGMQICDAAFPQEQELSLWMRQPLLLADCPTKPRHLQSRRYADMSIDVSVNKNLVDFYDHYPPSQTDGSFMTRWAMLAHTPFAGENNKQLLDMLRRKTEGAGELEAVERLLNWVQTAFVYEYDDKVWGCDRAFFPDETLYYPYCDCEDRSILLARLITDLLGLKCALVYYPGHLAMAVCFSEQVAGDYIEWGGQRFVVCDPTFINARVGRTMTGMDNTAAKLILIQ